MQTVFDEDNLREAFARSGTLRLSIATMTAGKSCNPSLISGVTYLRKQNNQGGTMGADESRRVSVSFETPRPGKLVAIDGTTCRDCEILDLSETGAQLRIQQSPGSTQEFFLLLTNFGAPVFRRCRVLRVQGDTLDVEFPSRNKQPKQPPRNPNALVH